MGDGDERGEGGGGGEEVKEDQVGGRRLLGPVVESSLPTQVGGAPRVRGWVFYNVEHCLSWLHVFHLGELKRGVFWTRRGFF